MAFVNVKSSAILGVLYHSKSKTLEVHFTDGTYSKYSDVSKKTYNELLKAKSVGTYFNNSIRNNYPEI